MKNHIPLRMCMACREMKPKSELFRIVSHDGKAVIDEKMVIQARGAYVCRNKDCIAMLKKKRCIERFVCSDTPEAYEKLQSYMCPEE